MSLNIRNPEAEKLAEEVDQRTGETKTRAVIQALRQRLDRIQHMQARVQPPGGLQAIADQCAALPILDGRSTDAILGYDADGLPG